MPDATTDGTHGKSTTKVIEDHPWAMFGVCNEFMGGRREYKKMRTKDPGCDLRVPWGKGNNNKRQKSEKQKGVGVTRVVVQHDDERIGEETKPAEIFRLGPAHDHVDEGVV